MILYSILFLLGVLLGALANLAAESLGWFSQRRNPWLPTDSKTLQKPDWRDRCPIVGWVFFARKRAGWGRFFWVRPLLVEILMGGVAIFFYRSSVESILAMSNACSIPLDWGELLSIYCRYAFQMIFVWIMLSASLIDMDEKTIPDSLTVSGTLFALLVAAAFPITLPWGVVKSEIQMVPEPHWVQVVEPIVVQPPTQLYYFPEIFWSPKYCSHAILQPLSASAPFPALGVMREDGVGGLLSALACWAGWCFALLDRRWYSKRGFGVALAIFVRRILRAKETSAIYRMFQIGLFFIIFVWVFNSPHWFNLHTALLGLGISGGFLWLIRLTSAFAMGREAMGFGDVLLFAMFGAFLGWQPCIILFFIAPFAGLVVGLLLWLLRKETIVPYGPFLCLGALFVMWNWCFLWYLTRPIFALGGRLALLGAGCLLLMAILLSISRWIKRRLGIDA
ncbi:MAG: A24 family peptidase [Planctomycetia bacterium]|nr:A24 family peptidase [Planctomycetia bacterium]